MRFGRVGDAPVRDDLRTGRLRTRFPSAIAQGDHAIEGPTREGADVLDLMAGDVHAVFSHGGDGERVQRGGGGPGAGGHDT